MSEPTGLTTKDLSKASPAFKTSLFGIAGATVTGAVAKMTEVCPDLIAQLPTFLIAGALAGWAYWLRGPRSK